MATNLPPPDQLPTIDEIIADLRRRYGVGGDVDYTTPIPDYVPPPPRPPPPSLGQRATELGSEALSGMASVVGAPARGMNALQREIYRRMYPEGSNLGEPIDSGRMFQQGVLPDVPREERTAMGEAERSATRAAGGFASDPLSTALLLGTGGLSGGARAAAHASLGAMMATSVGQRLWQAYKAAKEYGVNSPEFGAPAGELAFDAALLGGPPLARGAMRVMRPAPGVEAPVVPAEALATEAAPMPPSGIPPDVPPAPGPGLEFPTTAPRPMGPGGTVEMSRPISRQPVGPGGPTVPGESLPPEVLNRLLNFPPVLDDVGQTSIGALSRHIENLTAHLTELQQYGMTSQALLVIRERATSMDALTKAIGAAQDGPSGPQARTLDRAQNAPAAPPPPPPATLADQSAPEVGPSPEAPPGAPAAPPPPAEPVPAVAPAPAMRRSPVLGELQSLPEPVRPKAWEELKAVAREAEGAGASRPADWAQAGSKAAAQFPEQFRPEIEWQVKTLLENRDQGREWLDELRAADRSIARIPPSPGEGSTVPGQKGNTARILIDKKTGAKVEVYEEQPGVTDYVWRGPGRQIDAGARVRNGGYDFIVGGDRVMDLPREGAGIIYRVTKADGVGSTGVLSPAGMASQYRAVGKGLDVRGGLAETPTEGGARGETAGLGPRGAEARLGEQPAAAERPRNRTGVPSVPRTAGAEPSEVDRGRNREAPAGEAAAAGPARPAVVAALAPVPPAPVSLPQQEEKKKPAYVKTPEGEQALIPGSEVAKGPASEMKGQGPLFNPVERDVEAEAQATASQKAREEEARAARERKNAKAQKPLAIPHEEAPAPRTEPPPAIVRADLGRQKGGKGWAVRGYDAGGALVDQTQFPSREEAQPTLDSWIQAAQKNRRPGAPESPTEDGARKIRIWLGEKDMADDAEGGLTNQGYKRKPGTNVFTGQWTAEREKAIRDHEVPGLVEVEVLGKAATAPAAAPAAPAAVDRKHPALAGAGINPDDVVVMGDHEETPDGAKMLEESLGELRGLREEQNALQAKGDAKSLRRSRELDQEIEDSLSEIDSTMTTGEPGESLSDKIRAWLPAPTTAGPAAEAPAVPTTAAGPATPVPVADQSAAQPDLPARSGPAFDRWLKNRGVASGPVSDAIRKAAVQHYGLQRKVRDAQNRLIDAQTLRPTYDRRLNPQGLSRNAISKKKAEARDAVRTAETVHEASIDTLRAAVPKNVTAKEFEALRRIVEGRLSEPTKRAPVSGMALLPVTSGQIDTMNEEAPWRGVSYETLPDRVQKYAAERALPLDAAIRELEGWAAEPPDVKHILPDIQGVGQASFLKALQNPTGKEFQKVAQHLARQISERRALHEAIAEDGVILHPSQAAQDDLAGIALGLQANLADLRPEEDPQLEWGINDPGTGKPVTARAAVAAIESRVGRLYARLIDAQTDARAAESPVDDVPFDVGNVPPGEDIPPFESSGQGYAKPLFSMPLGRAIVEESRRLTATIPPGIIDTPRPLVDTAPRSTLHEGPPDVRGVPESEDPLHLGLHPRGVRPAIAGVPGGAAGHGERGRDLQGGGAGRAGAPAGEAQALPRRAPDVASRPATVAPQPGIFAVTTARAAAAESRRVEFDRIPQRLLKYLRPHQQVGVAKALVAMDEDEHGFLLADGTGVGKTREILAVADYWAREKKKPVIIFVPPEVLKVSSTGPTKGQVTGSYADDSREMSLPFEYVRLSEKGTPKGPELQAGKVYLTTYSHIMDRQQVTPDTVVIFDESHYVKNNDAGRGAIGQQFAKRAYAVLFATATPGDQAHHLMYLRRIGFLEDKTEAEQLRDLGMVSGTNKDGDVVWRPRNRRKMKKRLRELFERLTARAKTVKREIDFSGTNVDFVDVPLSEERATELDKIADAWSEDHAFDKRMRFMHQRRQLEPDKLPYVQNEIERALGEGRSVIVFAQRLRHSEVIKRTKIRDPYTGQEETLEEFITASEGTLHSLATWMKSKGIAYSEIHGEIPKSSQIEAMNEFQSGKTKVVIATAESGGTGINLDDRTGKNPRTMIVMTAPLESTTFVQALGRAHRLTTRSLTRYKVLISGHSADTHNMEIFATKIGLMGAMVSGSIAKLDPSLAEEIDEFGEPSLSEKGGDPDAKATRAAILRTLKEFTFDSYRRTYAPQRRITTERQYNYFRKTIEKALGGEVDRYGDFEIPSTDGLSVKGRLTKPVGARGPFGREGPGFTSGLFEYHDGDQLEAGGRENRGYVRDVEDLIEDLPAATSWRDWLKRHHAAVNNLFGDDAILFTRLLGATSQASSVATNVALATKAYFQMRRGEPFRGFLGSVIENLDLVRAGERPRGPKVEPYTRALEGDLSSVWADRHVSRFIIGPENLKAGATPTPKQAALVERSIREAARELVWEPAETTAAAWVLQQMNEGLKEEEIRDYPSVLREHAASIERFVDYFGSESGAGGRTLALGGPPRTGERNLFGARELEFDERKLHIPDTHSGSPESIEEAARVVDELTQAPLPVPEVLSFGKLPRYDRAPEKDFLARSVRTDLARDWRVSWEGKRIRTIEDLGLFAQMARHTALEQAHIVIVRGDEVIGSLQTTSGLPNSTDMLPAGWTFDRLKNYLRDTGATGFWLVHNHPDGNPEPSLPDLRSTWAFHTWLGRLFKGHVVVDHGSYTTITPEHMALLDRAITRGRDAVTETARLLWKGIPRQELRTDPGPDPLLAGAVDAKTYWGNPKLQIRSQSDFLRLFAQNLSSRAEERPGWPIIVLLASDARLRAAIWVDPHVFSDPAKFLPWLAHRKAEHGAISVLAVAPGFIRTPAKTEEFLRDYLQSGALVDAIDPLGNATRFGWQMHSDERGWETGGFGAREGEPYRKDDEARPGAETAAGSAGAPPARPPWGDGPGPGDGGWGRRADFSEARARVDGPWNAGRLFDALIAGLDRFWRGLRDFGRWAASMDFGGVGPFLRRIWGRIRGWFAPRAIEHRGARPDVNEFADAASLAAGIPGRRLRPIPRVRPEDVAAAEAALGREPTSPGARKPIGVGRPGDLPINIDRIRDENDLQQVMTDITNALRGRMDRARPVKTEAQIKTEALELGLSEADYLRLVRKKGALTAEEITAGRILRHEAGVDFTQKFQAWKDAKAAAEAETDPARQAMLRQTELEANRERGAALQKLIGISYGTVGAANEAGRALRAHAIMMESLTASERTAQRILRGFTPDERMTEELATAIANGDMAAVNRLYIRLHRPGPLKMAIEYFINSVLSGPATFGANVMGNAVHETMRTGERGVSSWLEQSGFRQSLERFLTGKDTPSERVTGEALEAAKALYKLKYGFVDMAKLAWNAVRFEDPTLYGAIKGEFHPPAIPGAFGKIVRTPGRIMEALDMGAKRAASAAEQGSQVLRRAVGELRQQGVDPNSRAGREMLRDRMNELNGDLTRYVELEENRRNDPQSVAHDDVAWMLRHRYLGDIYTSMKKAADVSTFRDETTKFTNYLKQMRGTYPWLSFIIPFVHTPERILIQAVRRTPVGLGKAVYEMSKGRLSGGEAADRLAQGLLGTAITAGIYMAAKDGLITGSGPADPDNRRAWLATGKQPYAVKVGNTWISLARIEPLATTLGFASDLAQATDDKVAGTAFDKLHYSIINNIAGKTYLEGIISASEAFSDPDRYGAALWRRMIGTAVPNLLASAARGIDPTLRQVDDVSSTLISRVPWLSETLPSKLTGTGEPIQRPEVGISRFMSPFRYSEEAGPERNLERLFLESGYSPSSPPKAIALPGTMGRQVTLTPDERRLYAGYAERATAVARQLAEENDFSTLDVYAKAEVLRRIYSFAHDAARRAVYGSVIGRVNTGQYELKQRRGA